MIISSKALYDCLLIDLLNCRKTSPAHQFAVAQLKVNVLKKFQDDVDLKLTSSKAIEKFKAMNFRCSEWKYQPDRMIDEYLLGAFEARVRTFFDADDFVGDLSSFGSSGRFGPGASIGARGFDFYTKAFDSPLTCTSNGIYKAYAIYTSRIPSWAEGEEIRSGLHGGPKIVAGSTLSCVPKTNAIARTICTEPGLNMFFQLGYGEAISRRLKHLHGIDLSTQPDRHACLARFASQTGSLFTLDLESASDTVSLAMCERFLPPWVFSTLSGLRSKATKLPSGEWLELNMMSSMGNGFTFPLQTALFTCAVLACSDVMGIKAQTRWSNPKPSSAGVFGDDIIAPKALFSPVSRLLGLLGFIVNTEKSFAEGQFRESCGADYFAGSAVRSVYIKTLSTQESRYVAINSLNEWSAVFEVPLPETISYLLRGVRFLPVPLFEQVDSGIRVPLTCLRSVRYRKSWGTSCFVYHKRITRPKVLEFCEDSIRAPRGERSRSLNTGGALTALLGGYIRSNKVVLRNIDGSIRSGTSRCVTSNWDFLQPISYGAKDLHKSQVLYQRLVTASWLNLSYEGRS